MRRWCSRRIICAQIEENGADTPVFPHSDHPVTLPRLIISNQRLEPGTEEQSCPKRRHNFCSSWVWQLDLLFPPGFVIHHHRYSALSNSVNTISINKVHECPLQTHTWRGTITSWWFDPPGWSDMRHGTSSVQRGSAGEPRVKWFVKLKPSRSQQYYWFSLHLNCVALSKKNEGPANMYHHD